MQALAIPVPFTVSVTHAKTRDEVVSQPEALDFDVVYREQRTRVLSIVRSVVGPTDELEDVVQLVFIEVHRCLPRFEGRSRLSTWLYRIAVNVALQHLRKKRRRRWLVFGADEQDGPIELVAPDDMGRVEDRQVLAHVQDSVARLSEKKRVVWQLHELQGLEPQEIADILDIPMNTVRSRLLAARKELMDDLTRKNILPRRDTP
ncbi:MAG: RNA polymerase sigma factor [Deltaproteobacteria bacterium]|nr:RNA polymerase sigma factor [Deltaproteobacteria bacterium]